MLTCIQSSAHNHKTCGASSSNTSSCTASSEHPSWIEGAGCTPLDLRAWSDSTRRWGQLLDVGGLRKGAKVFLCYDGREISPLESDPWFAKSIFADAAVVLVEGFLSKKEVSHMQKVIEQFAVPKADEPVALSAYGVAAQYKQHYDDQPSFYEEPNWHVAFDDKFLNRIEQRIAQFLKIPASPGEQHIQYTMETGPRGPNFHHDKSRGLLRRATALIYVNGGPGSGLVGGETMFPALPRRRPESVGKLQRRSQSQAAYSHKFKDAVQEALRRVSDKEANPEMQVDATLRAELAELCLNASSQAFFVGADDATPPTLSIAPMPGRAVFHWSEGTPGRKGERPGGKALADVFHSGCPVQRGRKMILQKFKHFDPTNPECQRLRWCDKAWRDIFHGRQ